MVLMCLGCKNTERFLVSTLETGKSFELPVMRYLIMDIVEMNCDVRDWRLKFKPILYWKGLT
ncbi:hypothetical protein DMZ48_03065 [Robertkochia solimangrovi]|nr:hypothetical protein DMZ48_03065 [Robertkochia solimangrovi]